MYGEDVTGPVSITSDATQPLLSDVVRCVGPLRSSRLSERFNEAVADRHSWVLFQSAVRLRGSNYTEAAWRSQKNGVKSVFRGTRNSRSIDIHIDVECAENCVGGLRAGQGRRLGLPLCPVRIVSPVMFLPYVTLIYRHTHRVVVSCVSKWLSPSSSPSLAHAELTNAVVRRVWRRRAAGGAIRRYGVKSATMIETAWWRNCSTLLMERASSMVRRCRPTVPLPAVLGGVADDVAGCGRRSGGGVPRMACRRSAPMGRPRRSAIKRLRSI